MTVTLYRNNSDPEVVKKLLTQIVQLTGTLREPTSILDPVLSLEAEVDIISSCNYVYIAEFKRYYFITNVRSIRNGLWEIAMHVDVLMSHKVKLLRQNAIIARQENLYNLYLDDDKFLVDSQRIYTTLDFPNRVASASTGNDVACFVLTLAGGNVGQESQSS